MKYRRLDPKGDYTLGAKESTGHYEDAQGVLQAIFTRLNLYLGEWWEDLDDGMALYEQIVGQFNDVETVELLITQRISETLGVEFVDEINSVHNTEKRTLAYSCRVTTVYEDTALLEIGFDGHKFIKL